MEITTERQDRDLSVHESGRIDAGNASDSEQTVRTALEDGDRTVIMDFENLRIIGSSGLRVVLMGNGETGAPERAQSFSDDPFDEVARPPERRPGSRPECGDRSFGRWPTWMARTTRSGPCARQATPSPSELDSDSPNDQPKSGPVATAFSRWSMAACQRAMQARGASRSAPSGVIFR